MKITTKYTIVNLTKEDVLKRYNALEIFNMFSDKPLFNYILTNSPLRKDRNPSFIILGEGNSLNYFDFSNGDTGDCFTFVMKKCNVDFKTALNLIYSKQNVKHFTLLDVKPSKNSITFVSDYYKSYHAEFWKSFNISKNTLDYFKIRPVLYYYINNNLFNCKQHTYAYKVGSRIKFYQPFEENYKFFGNTNRNSIQGYEFLEFKQDDLYVVASYKEVMIMHELGFEAIAPNSETTLFDKFIMEYLQSKYTQIYVLFDWDEAGYAASDRFVKYYDNIKQIKIKADEKDLSDYSKKYNLKKTYSLILEWKK